MNFHSQFASLSKEHSIIFHSHSDNFNTIASVLLIGALGLDHFNRYSKKIRSNIIAVDLVSRGIILAGWRTGVETKADIQVYNAASMRDFSYTILNSMTPIPRKFETSQAVAPCYGVTIENPVLNFLAKFFVIWIPFFVLDCFLVVFRQKPRLIKVQRVIQNVYDSLKYFLSHQFKIDNYNFLDLNKRLKPEEKEEFEITLKGRFFEICESYYRHVVVNTFKEDAVKRAKAKQRYPLIFAYHYGFLCFYVFLIYKAISLYIFG